MRFRSGDRRFARCRGGPFCHGPMARACKGTQQIPRFITRNRPGNEANDKIARRQFRHRLAKALTHASLDTVAVHRTCKQALGDDHAQPGVSHLIGPRHDHQIIGTGTLIAGKYPIKISLVDQPGIAEAYATRRFARCFGIRVDQTARRARPLARRALITARPALVFMRARKPWVRLRRTVEGW